MQQRRSLHDFPVITPVKSLRKRRLSASSTMSAAKHQPPALDANGNPAGVIVSGKTGARTRVGVAYAVRFQAYIDDLENNYGARVLFMHGLRPGRCSISSEHPCGKALDVCQLRRGVIDRRCNLPGRVVLGQIAEFAWPVRRRSLVHFGLWPHPSRYDRRSVWLSPRQR